MTPNKRVLIYIKDPKGGTGTFIKNFSFLLQNHNFDVLLVSHNNECLGLSNEIKLGYFIKQQNSISISDIKKTFINAVLFIKEVSNFKPQYIYSLDLYANIISLLVVRIFFRKIKLIISTHVNLHEHIYYGRNILFSKFIIMIIKLLYPYANQHITPSRELTLSMIKFINNNQIKIKTIYCPINQKEIISLYKTKEYKKKYTLTTFARLESQKNVELLINTIIHMNTTRKKKLSLQIIGNGSNEDDLKRKYFIYSYIKFLGWKKNPFPYLLNSKIFILISKYEGFGYSILEAMTLGRPVIVSDVDYGPREIIGKNMFGLLTKNNIRDISKNITSMLIKKNYLKYKRQSILRSKDFDLIKLSTHYLSLFNNLN